MYRTSFLSTDFFVATSETEARRILASLPGHLSQLTLLRENHVVHSTRFLYSHPEKTAQFYIDVSLLQLNDQYIRFSLHGSHTNGQKIQSDTEINQALKFFEQAVAAAFSNDFAALNATINKTVTEKRTFPLFQNFLSLFLSKYHY